MRNLAALVILSAAVAHADAPVVPPDELKGIPIEAAQGRHQLISLRVLEAERALGPTRVIVWEEKSRLVDGIDTQETTMLGIGGIASRKILLRLPLQLSAKKGPDKSISFRYSQAWTDLDGDGIPELILRRGAASAHEYGPIDVPGEPAEPNAPRDRVFQVRAGGLHELPRAIITGCPRKGDAAMPLEFARHEKLPAALAQKIDAATGASLTENAPEVRCALWDRWCAQSEAPVAWVQTETAPVPAPGAPVWLAPAGPKPRVVWFRTVDGGAARLTWDGTMLQVIEPNIPPTAPEVDDKPKPPIHVLKFDALPEDARLMLYMDIQQGPERRAIVYDPVKLELLVNVPVKSAPSFRNGELHAGATTFRYDRAKHVWRQR